MELTLTRNHAPRKGDRLVIYNIEGRRGTVQFLTSLFDKEVPTLKLVGEFAEPKVPVAKLTAEERKARRALLPKLTPAEKLAQMEKRVATMRAQLAATSKAPAPTAIVTTPKVVEVPREQTSAHARSAKRR
jgi:hypothetical protein